MEHFSFSWVAHFPLRQLEQEPLRPTPRKNRCGISCGTPVGTRAGLPAGTALVTLAGTPVEMLSATHTINKHHERATHPSRPPALRQSIGIMGLCWYAVAETAGRHLDNVISMKKTFSSSWRFSTGFKAF